LEVSTSLTVTVVFELRSAANADSEVLANLVVEAIEAVIVAPVSGRVTEIELNDIALRVPTTDITVL
jgi:hypothetical protein